MGIDPFFSDHWTTIYQGSCLDVLPMLPANSVHACITSPPYFGLRDYNTATWEGGDPGCAHRNGPLASPRSTLQGYTGPHVKLAVGWMPFQGTCGRCGAVRHDQGIGNEAVPDCNGAFTGQPCLDKCWVCRLVAVFREVRRVLRPDGTLWLNVGTAYQEKQDLGLPWRLAFALQANGWILRQELIWHKINSLPESVQDRCTKAHEQIFLLTKRPTYHFDAVAIQEPSRYPDDNRKARQRPDDYTARAVADRINTINPLHARTYPMRQCRSVWPLASEPLRDIAHFATFPSALVRRCLLASCSAGGVCAGCGAPYRRQVERTLHATRGKAGLHNVQGRHDPADKGCQWQATGGVYGHYETTTTGFAPACSCGPAAGVTSAVCLDPFFGSGTVALVARDLFIKSIGIELNPSYTEMSVKRMVQGVLALVPGS